MVRRIKKKNDNEWTYDIVWNVIYDIAWNVETTYPNNLKR